jgi:hypothetical protein
MVSAAGGSVCAVAGRWQLDSGLEAFLAATADQGGTHWVPVLRCGNAEGIGVADRFAEKVHERRVDAGVRDAT